MANAWLLIPDICKFCDHLLPFELRLFCSDSRNCQYEINYQNLNIKVSLFCISKSMSRHFCSLCTSASFYVLFDAHSCSAVWKKCFVHTFQRFIIIICSKAAWKKKGCHRNNVTATRTLESLEILYFHCSSVINVVVCSCHMSPLQQKCLSSDVWDVGDWTQWLLQWLNRYQRYVKDKKCTALLIYNHYSGPLYCINMSHLCWLNLKCIYFKSNSWRFTFFYQNMVIKCINYSSVT